jgi:hypothetical protein
MHPNQVHPRRAQVSAAARKPAPRYYARAEGRALHRARRWRTGPGPSWHTPVRGARTARGAVYDEA